MWLGDLTTVGAALGSCNIELSLTTGSFQATVLVGRSGSVPLLESGGQVMVGGCWSVRKKKKNEHDVRMQACWKLKRKRNRLSRTLLLFHESALYSPWGWGRGEGVEGGDSSVYISVTAMLVVRIENRPLVLHKVFQDIPFKMQIISLWFVWAWALTHCQLPATSTLSGLKITIAPKSS